MKAFCALALGFVFVGQAALAKDVYSYRRPVLVQQSQPGRFCPQVLNVTALNEPNSLRGQAVSITTPEGQTTFSYQYSTRSCISDMVCDSYHHYTTPGVMMEVELQLNNDGAYPTTDRAGFAVLKIDLLSSSVPTRQSCSYFLN